MNRYKIRDQVGMCAIARHLQCFIMTKTWVDGSDLEQHQKEDKDQGTNEDVEMQSDHEEETKDSAQKESVPGDDLQKRGRGRPRKGDTTDYKPSPVYDRNKRVKQLLQITREQQESSTVDTIQKQILTLYDHVHDNLRDSITQNASTTELMNE